MFRLLGSLLRSVSTFVQLVIFPPLGIGSMIYNKRKRAERKRERQHAELLEAVRK
jgi:preprotein translocase subunit YajC